MALRRVPLVDIAPAVVLLAIGVTLQYFSVYRDSGIQHLTTRVDDGPYAGIYTTALKRGFLTRLDRDVAAATGRDCRIFFYNIFPAGYLFGHGRPATNATWFDVPDRHEARYQRLLLDYYAAHGGLPDVAVRLDRIPLTASDSIDQATRRTRRSSRFPGPQLRPRPRHRRLPDRACASVDLPGAVSGSPQPAGEPRTPAGPASSRERDRATCR